MKNFYYLLSSLLIWKLYSLFLLCFLKVFIKCVTVLLLFHVLVFWLWSMWDLSSPTRDGTHTPCTGSQSLNHWTTRKSLFLFFYSFPRNYNMCHIFLPFHTGLKLNIQKAKIMASSPITSWQIDGETMETVTGFIFLGSKITENGECSHEIKRHLLLGRKAMTKLDSILKKQRHYFADKGLPSQSYGFSTSHVWIWELDYEPCWVPKNWCAWTVVLEKTLESPLDCKELKPVNPKGNHSWIFIGRTDAETPVLWPFVVKNSFIGKDPDAGKEGRKRRGQQRMRWLDGTTDSTDMSLTSSKSWWWTGNPGVLQSMGSQTVRHDWMNWTELNNMYVWLIKFLNY